MPRRWRPRWGGRCTRWRTRWSLMNLLSSGKGSNCALIETLSKSWTWSTRNSFQQAQILFTSVAVSMSWKFCMTRHTFIYITSNFCDEITSAHMTFFRVCFYWMWCQVLYQFRIVLRESWGSAIIVQSSRYQCDLTVIAVFYILSVMVKAAAGPI